MTEHDPAPPGQLQCANVSCIEDAEYVARADRLDGSIEYGLCADHRGVRAVRPLSWCGGCDQPLLGDDYDRSHVVNTATAAKLGCDPGVYHEPHCPACLAGCCATQQAELDAAATAVAAASWSPRSIVVLPQLTPGEVDDVVDALRVIVDTWRSERHGDDSYDELTKVLNAAFSEALANHRGPG